MIILDTDVLSHIQMTTSVGTLIESRLDLSPDQEIGTTSINAHEMLIGAMSLIERRKRERSEIIAAFTCSNDCSILFAAGKA